MLLAVCLVVFVAEEPVRKLRHSLQEEGAAEAPTEAPAAAEAPAAEAPAAEAPAEAPPAVAPEPAAPAAPAEGGAAKVRQAESSEAVGVLG